MLSNFTPIHKKKTWIIFPLAILLLFILTSSSFWIDESYTAYFASLKGFDQLISQMYVWKGSEAQMPGYIIGIWVWAKIFGISEYALRSFNLVFMIPMFFLLLSDNKNMKIRLLTTALIISHPFIWYNLDEARCTIPIFSLATIILLIMTRESHTNRQLGTVSFLLLLGTSLNMLFIFFIPGLLICDYLKTKRNRVEVQNFFKKWSKVLLISLPVMLILSMYYYHTLLNGAGGMKQKPGLGNIGFVFYEFMGFSGLGPPRNLLRNNIAEYGLSHVLPAAIYMIFLATILTAIIKKKTFSFFKDPLIISFIIAFLFFFCVSYYVGFRFLGRHIAFLLPFILLYFANNIEFIKDYFNPKYAIITIALIYIFLLGSSLNIRFNNDYRKDNYKDTINYVLDKMKEKTIYVVADRMTSSYYGLRFADFKVPDSWTTVKAAGLVQLNGEEKNILPGKDIVMYSKKWDIFDPHREIQNYIKKKNFKIILENNDFIIYG